MEHLERSTFCLFWVVLSCLYWQQLSVNRVCISFLQAPSHPYVASSPALCAPLNLEALCPQWRILLLLLLQRYKALEHDEDEESDSKPLLCLLVSFTFFFFPTPLVRAWNAYMKWRSPTVSCGSLGCRLHSLAEWNMTSLLYTAKHTGCTFLLECISFLPMTVYRPIVCKALEFDDEKKDAWISLCMYNGCSGTMCAFFGSQLSKSFRHRIQM